MGRRPQHSKSRKRPRRWHRGRSEAHQWRQAERVARQLDALPTAGGDPTEGAPVPLSNSKGRRNRGDAL